MSPVDDCELSRDDYELSRFDETQPELRKQVEDGLHAYNVGQSEEMRQQSRPLELYVRDRDGRVRGGLLGRMRWWWTGRGCLEVGVLWLDEPLRRSGHGSRLLRQAEEAARAAGCARVTLHTFSFQARPFYEKQGYRVFGQLEDFPPGGAAYWMVKELG